MDDWKKQNPPFRPFYPFPSLRTDVSLVHRRPIPKLCNDSWGLRGGGHAVQLADGLQVNGQSRVRGRVARVVAAERADVGVGVRVRGEVALVDGGRARVLHAVVG